MSNLPPTSPLLIEDFSGGITDNVLSNDTRKAEEFDNLLITDDKKPKTVPGSEIYDETNYQAPDQTRINTLVNYMDDLALILGTGRKLYADQVVAGSEIKGPTSNSAFSAGSATSHVSHAEWRDHLILANDAGARPVVAFKDGSTWSVLTAGLPEVSDTENYVEATVLANAITQANSIRTSILGHLNSNMDVVCAKANTLKAQFNLHLVGTTVFPHHFPDNTNTITAPDATDSTTLCTLVNQIKSKYNDHIADAALGSGWAYHWGQAAAPGRETVGTVTNFTANETYSSAIDLISAAVILVDILQKYNAHDNDDPSHAAFGSFQVASITDPYYPAHPDRDAAAYAVLSVTPAASGTGTTGLDSLKTLVSGMISAYGKHYGDSILTNPAYHRINIYQSGTVMDGVEATIAAPTATINPTNLVECIVALNRIRIMFNYHAGIGHLHNALAGENYITDSSTFLAEINSGPYVSSGYEAIYSLATALKSKINSHIARMDAGTSTPHLVYSLSPVPYDLTITTATPTDPLSLSDLMEELEFDYGAHSNLHVDAGSVASSAHYNGTTNVNPPSSSRVTYEVNNWDVNGGYAPGDIAKTLERLKIMRTAYNTHQADITIHKDDAALGNLDPVPVNTIEFANYLYSFHYFYEYDVNGITYEVDGPVLEKEFSNVLSVETQDLVISGIGAIANGATDNYDTSNIKVRIYRTQNNGSTLYKVGEITNGTTTFTDRVTDAQLTSNESIYTEGGVVSYDQAPIAKYVHSVNDFGYYLNVTTADGEVLANRMIQSVAGAVWTGPRDSSIDFDEPGVGVSSARGRVVVGTTRSIYRVEGQYDDRGGGGMVKEKISDRVGLVSHKSMVQIDQGLLFAGTDGFYFTDGYQLQKISTEFNRRYRQLVNSATKRGNLVGTYDKLNQLVHWGVQYSDDSTDNDRIFTFDLKQDIKPDGAFTTRSGGTSFNPTALVVYNDQLIRGDKDGYVFKHDTSYTTDPTIGAGIPGTWATQTIVHRWKSIATNFGRSDVKKLVPRMTFKAEPESNLSLQITSINDRGKATKDLKPIRFWKLPEWGDPLVRFGDPEVWFNYTGEIEGTRPFPADGGLRCHDKQIEITNAKVVIMASDASCTATVDATAKTVLLNDTTNYAWPANFVGYSIAFEDDGYVTEFAITGRTATTLTYSDADDDTASGSTKKWVVRGKPKDEVLHLSAVGINFVPLTNSFTPFQGGTQGENA